MKLGSCPFCGCSAKITEAKEGNENPEHDKGYYVSCTNRACRANLNMIIDSKAEAAEKWNTRVFFTVEKINQFAYTYPEVKHGKSINDRKT